MVTMGMYYSVYGNHGDVLQCYVTMVMYYSVYGNHGDVLVYM